MKSLSTKDGFEFVNYLEEEFNFQNWKIEGVDVWPEMRIHIINLIDSIGRVNSKYPAWKVFPEFLGLINILKQFFLHSDKFIHSYNQCDILFLTYSTAKQSKIQGKWFNSFIDPVINVLNSVKKFHNTRFQILEYSPLYNYKIPGWSDSKMIQPTIFLNKFKARLLERNLDLNQSKKYIDIINGEIDSKLGLNIKVELNYIAKRASQTIANRNFFYGILKKCKPSVVILSNYYGLEKAMCLACSELNIPVVDIQHGAQGEFHFAYGQWKSVPINGYNTLPDLFAEWGEGEKKVIDSWAHKTKHQATEIGNGFAEFVSELREENPELEEIKKKEKPKILISLQPNRGIDTVYYELLVQNQGRFLFYFRSHPTMTKEEVRDIKSELSDFNNCYFHESSSILLYKLLPFMTAHITQNSSVTIEAKSFGVPTVLIHQSGYDLFFSIIDNKTVFFSTEPDKIFNLLEQIGRNKQNLFDHSKDLSYRKNMSRLISNFIIGKD